MSVQAPTSPTSTQRPKVRGILKAAAINVPLSVAANVILFLVLKAVLNLPAGFPPFNFGPIILLTTIGTILAGVAFAVVARLARDPVRIYAVVAGVALVVSIVPNLGAMANPASLPFPGGTPLYFGILIAFHVLAGLVSFFTLTRLTRVK